MPLNSNAKNFKANFPDRINENGQLELNGTLQTVLYYSMLVGLGEITSKNALEWYFRMRMYDALFGAIGMDNQTREYISIPLTVSFTREPIYTLPFLYPISL